MGHHTLTYHHNRHSSLNSQGYSLDPSDDLPNKSSIDDEPST